MHKAVDLVTGSTVAIKVISLEGQHPEQCEEIEKEIEFLSSCNHPNIVQYMVSKCAHMYTSSSGRDSHTSKLPQARHATRDAAIVGSEI